MQRVYGTQAASTTVLDPATGVVTVHPPVSDVRPLVESEVFGKVGILALLALAAGAVSFVFPVSIGFALVCVFVALGLGLWASFRPRLARVLGPAYAAVEGLGLGVFSRLYDEQSHGIVPVAVLLTVGLFFGVLISYRTGLVRVSSRFVSMTMVATFALLIVMLAVVLGLNFPGLGSGATSLIVFGVIYTLIAIANLYADFSFVAQAARAGVPADAEWYAAFSIFLSVVMLYLGILRILGGRR
jgi:uncharacterized YccA/Bax inhibitor family protein